MEKTSSKTSQRNRRWWLAALIAAVALAGWVVVGAPWWQRSKAKHDVDVLVVAVRGFIAENGRAPTGTLAQIAALLRGEDVGGQNPRRLDYVVARLREMNAAGEFIDPWGTPYRIQTAPEPRAYSCGPNRRDEAGEGDDICSWK